MITFSSSLPFQVFPNYHIYPPTAPHVAYMQPKANAPSFFMADELRQVRFQKLGQTLIIGYPLEQENGCAGHCLVSHHRLSKEIQNMEVLCTFKEILNNVLEYEIQNLVFKCASFLCFVFFVQKGLYMGCFVCLCVYACLLEYIRESIWKLEDLWELIFFLPPCGFWVPNSD